jgi:hypothetical protein
VLLDCCEIDFFVGLEECYGGDVDTVREGIALGSGHFGGVQSISVSVCKFLGILLFIPNVTGG